MKNIADNLEGSIKILDQAFRGLRDKGVTWSPLPDSDLPFRNLCIEIINAVAKE